jgi:PAS domain S-box-containing protein
LPAGEFTDMMKRPHRLLLFMTLPLHNEDYFQQFADGAPVMIWMSGLDMGCFYFNRAWLDFRGRTLEQEAGNGWAEGVHPEDLERCVNHYVSCFERRVAFAMSYRLLDSTGTHRWILDRGAPHSLPDGTFLGFFGGCAEIETDTPLSRHRELGTSLAQMKAFALRVAQQQATATEIASAPQAQDLQKFARNTHDDYADRLARMSHAVREIEQLADDMASFGALAAGQCVP